MKRRRIVLGVLLPISYMAMACRPPAGDPHETAADSLRKERPAPAFRSQAILHERAGAGRAAYLGFDVHPPPPARPGDVLDVTHYFEAFAAFRGEYAVFVHGDAPGGGQRLLTADHPPVGGKAPTHRWKTGDIWADRHRIRIPPEAGAAMDLYVGLFAGDVRLTVQAPPGGSDGEDRILAGRIPISGGEGGSAAAAPADDLPSATIPRAAGAIAADGVLDEAAWTKAPVLELWDSMGRDVDVEFPTKLRLLWDDANLYVAFDSTDRDVSCPYKNRDDPIYEHEAVELFIMPGATAPALGPYVELQASPRGVIFDAAFTARRTGMDTRFNAAQTVGTKVDGTLDDPDAADRGWVSEWVVPWTSLRGVAAAPKTGDEWRMNAFRIEKHRDGDKMNGEYTAWSPPRVGDFHNTARFGRMIFGP